MELPAKKFCQSSPFTSKIVPNGRNRQCYLAGSSKTAPRILIFSIAIDADYSYEVKNNEIWAPAFFKHNNSFIATVIADYLSCTTERKVKLLSSLILYICSKIPPASLLSTLEYAYVRTYLYSFDIPGQRNNLLFIEKVTTMHITCPCLMGRIGGIGLVLIPFTLKNAHL